MITFNHNDKSFSLGPRAIFVDDPFLKNAEENEKQGGNENKTKFLSIDGVLHSLFRTNSLESRQNRDLDEG